MTKTIAVIRVRGKINRTAAVKETLQRLHLHRQNYCTLVPDTSSVMGMVHKVKDFVTWGVIDDALAQKLKSAYERKDHRKNKPKKFFRLNPPRKGFGRQGIKTPYSMSGALGNRGEAISNLLERMM